MQEGYVGGLLCDQGILPCWASLGLGSLCKSQSSISEGPPQGVDIDNWHLQKKLIFSPTWTNALGTVKWFSLYLDKLIMLSLNIEVLPEKELRSTVTCHRSQCFNTSLFSGASQGQHIMVLWKVGFQHYPWSGSLQSFVLHYWQFTWHLVWKEQAGLLWNKLQV